MVVALALAAGCAQHSALVPSDSEGSPPAFGSAAQPLRQKIRHIVVIVQENRTTNDLFNGLPGAQTVLAGKNSHGALVRIQARSLEAPYDLSHEHGAFETEYADGKLNGFDLVKSGCHKHVECPPRDIRAYGYVPEREVEPYFIMAKRYVFANHMFQTNQGPSFPAHQYILSGTSTISNGSPLRAAENAHAPHNETAGGCDSPKKSMVTLIDPHGNENLSAYPCFNRRSIIELIEAKSLTWSYYQAHLGPGIWEGPDAILPVYDSPGFSRSVITPPARVLNDIRAGNLADVVWITPTPQASDHAGVTDGSGPSWVAAVVNEIGRGRYWKDTAIFVIWDDWGGWYDPINPPQYNSYELGFRVPLIVISAYSKHHHISKRQHEFGSILKFIEETFGLGSLGTTDIRADDLSDCFDFSMPPSKFVPITAPLTADYFLKRPSWNQTPDDDF